MFVTTKNILRLLGEKGISANKLAIDCGLNNSAITEWKKGKSNPSAKSLQKIADHFHLPLSYFYEEHADNYEPIPFPGGYATHFPNATSLADVTLARIPILGDISAGTGVYADENFEGYEIIDEKDLRGLPKDEFIFVRVSGDSMEPTLLSGDLALIHRQESVDSGALAAILVDNEEGYIKVVEYGRNWIELISDNPKYDVMRFENDEVLRVRIMGKVFASKRNY